MESALKIMEVERSTCLITYAQPGLLYRHFEEFLQEKMHLLLQGKKEGGAPAWKITCSVALSPEDASTQIRKLGDLEIFHFPNLYLWPKARLEDEAKRIARTLSFHENKPWVSLEENSAACAPVFEAFGLTTSYDPLERLMFDRWLVKRKMAVAV